MEQITKTESEFEKFKSWVENTQLFHAIVDGSQRATVMESSIRLLDGSLTLNLNGKIVKSFDDLPKEMIMEFYRNSPWCITKQNEQQAFDTLKLLNR